LQAARRLGEARAVSVRTTFLGAHTVPAEMAGNKDGYIDKSEWAAVRGSGAEANKLFAQVNTAHNGKITLAEFTNNKTLVAGRKASFNALDKGHKGYLGSKDIVSYFAKRSAF
jgi:Ca2+-binding EF-hand superfamily protein